MSNENVTVRNKTSLVVGSMPRHLAEHPYFGAGVEIVPDGSKTFVPLSELNPSLDAPEGDEDDETEEGK